MLTKAVVMHRDIRYSATMEVDRYQDHVSNATSVGVVSSSFTLTLCAGYGLWATHCAEFARFGRAGSKLESSTEH